jgi:1-acyl-sn-glycerol-3-phosphate acyltransferase
VLTFPEAHRTSDGKVQPFKRGVFQIARDAGIPVVPIAVRGMFEVLPKGRFLIRPGNVEIYMGPEIPTLGLSDAQLDRLSERVRDILVDWVDHRRTCGELVFEPGARDAEDPAVA